MVSIFKWAAVAVLGLMVMLAGVGLVENPPFTTGHMLTGIVVLYSGCGIFCIAAVQMIRRQDW